MSGTTIHINGSNNDSNLVLESANSSISDLNEKISDVNEINNNIKDLSDNLAGHKDEIDNTNQVLNDLQTNLILSNFVPGAEESIINALKDMTTEDKGYEGIYEPQVYTAVTKGGQYIYAADGMADDRIGEKLTVDHGASIQSVGKSIFALYYAKAQDKGYIKGVNQPIRELAPVLDKDHMLVVPLTIARAQALYGTDLTSLNDGEKHTIPNTTTGEKIQRLNLTDEISPQYLYLKPVRDITVGDLLRATAHGLFKTKLIKDKFNVVGNGWTVEQIDKFQEDQGWLEEFPTREEELLNVKEIDLLETLLGNWTGYMWVEPGIFKYSESTRISGPLLSYVINTKDNTELRLQDIVNKWFSDIDLRSYWYGPESFDENGFTKPEVKALQYGTNVPGVYSRSTTDPLKPERNSDGTMAENFTRPGTKTLYGTTNTYNIYKGPAYGPPSSSGGSRVSAKSMAKFITLLANTGKCDNKQVIKIDTFCEYFELVPKGFVGDLNDSEIDNILDVQFEESGDNDLNAFWLDLKNMDYVSGLFRLKAGKTLDKGELPHSLVQRFFQQVTPSKPEFMTWSGYDGGTMVIYPRENAGSYTYTNRFTARDSKGEAYANGESEISDYSQDPFSHTDGWGPDGVINMLNLSLMKTF